MKALYFLQGYLAKSAGLKNVAKSALKSKKNVTSPLADAAGLGAAGAGATTAGLSTSKAQADASASDVAVAKSKEKLRKAQNPHNWPNKKK
jgi:uncharacterized protein YfiM (DUF2279 family)